MGRLMFFLLDHKFFFLWKVYFLCDFRPSRGLNFQNRPLRPNHGWPSRWHWKCFLQPAFLLLLYFIYYNSWVYDLKKIIFSIVIRNYLLRRFHRQKYDLIDILSRFEKEKKGNEKKIFFILFQNKVIRLLLW